MASEAVKKILEAEALSDKRNAEARKQRDEIINSASGSSSIAIQKKITEAASEAAKIRDDFSVKLNEYEKNAEAECNKKIDNIKQLAEKNMSSAVDEIIARYFELYSWKESDVKYGEAQNEKDRAYCYADWQ